MGVHYHFVEQGSDEWLQARDGMYTGSNADKLLGTIGVSEYAKARNDGFGGNFWTMRGHLLEDEALELYETITGEQLLRDDNGIKVGFVTNDKYPGCLYSPDGITAKLLEVKCFDLDKHMELVRGNIPLKIMAQIQYGYTITRLQSGVLIAYNPKAERVADKLAIVPVKRNAAAVRNFDRILKSLNEVKV